MEQYTLTFLWIAILLILAKLSSLVEKFRQPAVLGELLLGVALGNLFLLGVPFFEPIKQDITIHFLAELGVVILLFQIGLESSIEEMKKVGVRAMLVAAVGVAAPFIMGTYIVGPWLLPGLSNNAYLFLGATLTATSVGITARVFKDLNKLQLPEARIVLGAAVIDDVLGLIILAVVSAIATSGHVSTLSIFWIFTKSLLFLVGSIIIGQLVAPYLSKGFAKIQTGVGMKFSLALCFCLALAYLAQAIGLATIVGAFAAGLILRPVHFRFFMNPHVVDDLKKELKSVPSPHKEHLQKTIQKHADSHLHTLMEPLSFFLVPLFFVLSGMGVVLTALFDVKVLLVALAITAVAVIGKIVSGLVAGPVRKSLVGWGMVPRGEVGLIFAAIGKSLGVINEMVFSVIIIVIILTTLITPPILAYLLRKE